MQHITVKNGIQERLNFLLGCHDPDPSNGDSTALTVWSIQGCMVENARRIVKGLVGGDTNGRIMTGLQLTQMPNSWEFSISPGIGLTPAGNIIDLKQAIQANVAELGDDQAIPYATGNVIYVYLKWTEAVTTDSEGVTYHTSNILGSTTTPVSIVYDSVCAGTTDNTTLKGEIFFSETNSPSTNRILLAIITVTTDNPVVLQIENMQFGRWINYGTTSTVNGWDSFASMPSLPGGPKNIYYLKRDATVFVKFCITGLMTQTASNVNFTVPYNIAVLPISMPGYGLAGNSTTWSTYVNQIYGEIDAKVVNIYPNFNMPHEDWVLASGTSTDQRGVAGEFFYYTDE